LLRFATGSAMFSTLNDGKIVKGLHGVPNEGPVLLVGNHMLMGLEIYSLVPEFLREKNIMVRVVVHPVVFRERQGVSSPEFSLADWMKVMGAVPVTASNLFNLLSTKSHVLLYPGGAREALHNRVSQFPCVKFQQIYFFGKLKIIFFKRNFLIIKVFALFLCWKSDVSKRI
jgi:hypothetical protein